jgi:hypothetical protein
MAAKSGGAVSAVLLPFTSVVSELRLLKRLRSEGPMIAEWECACCCCYAQVIGYEKCDLRLLSGERCVCLLAEAICSYTEDRVVRSESHVCIEHSKGNKRRWRNKTTPCSEVAAAFT